MAIGLVRIDLEANTAEFDKQIKSFSKKLDKQIDNLGRNIVKLGAVATAAAAGISIIAKRQLDYADSLAKTADKIGVGIEELQALRYAAEQTGVAQNTLDMALQRFTRRLSEATQGTGEAKKALEELNIDANKLAELPVAEQMGIIADALNGVEKQSDRVRLSFKFFDSEGVALVNTLKEGSAGLKEYAQRANELGFIIDTKTARASERFNDKLSDLGKVADGFTNRLGAKLLPTLEKVVDELLEFAMSRDFEDLLNGVKVVVDSIVIAFQTVVLLFKGLRIVANVLAGNLDDANKQAESFLGTLDSVSKKINSLGSSTDFQAGIEVRAKVPEDINISQAIDDNVDALEGQFNKLDTFNEKVATFYKDITDLNSQFASAFINSFGRLEDALVSFVRSGKLNFRDLADSIISDILRIAIRQQIIAPLVGAATSAIGNISTAVTYGTNVGSEQTQMLQEQDMDFRALGGNVTGATSYIVGERGPEIFTPRTSGSITPNNKINTMGGGSQNVTVQILNESGQEMEATSANADFNGEEYIISVVLNANESNKFGFRDALNGGRM